MNTPFNARDSRPTLSDGMIIHDRSWSVARRCFGLIALAAIVTFSCCGRKASGTNSEEQSKQRLATMAAEIERTLKATQEQTSGLADEVVKLYADLDRLAAAADRSQYILESNGVLHRPAAVRNRQPAVYVSGLVKVNEEVMKAVLGTESLDPVLQRILDENPSVVQAYFNDSNSYNRIHPPLDVLTQYPPGMDIPTYNFYYLADVKHNPDRKVVWIKDPYVDPAGRGWMISCIAPVYQGDMLKGVAGLDITVEAIVRNFNFESANRMCLLAAADGTVVATGEPLIHVLRLPALKNHRYVDTVRSDTFRSDDYNLLKSRSVAIRSMADQLLVKGLPSAALELDDVRWTIRPAAIPALNWQLLEFIPRQ